MRFGASSSLRSVFVSALWLLPIGALAQVRAQFVGKWVVDVEKMVEVAPAWTPPPFSDRFIITAFGSGRLQIQGSSIWLPGFYDPSGEATEISLGEDEAIARGHWEDNRLVVRIEAVGKRHVVTRKVFREERWLVIEDNDQTLGSTIRAYFVKS